MRIHLFLLSASAGGASARWLRWSGSEASHGRMAVETGSLGHDKVADGWTPRPTPAPVYGELRRHGRRQTTATNTWLNEKTCGWFSGLSSSPYTCEQSQACATNTDNVVACVSGNLLPFFTACLDYAASKEGRCQGAGLKTGCCNKLESSACATLIWSGSPSRYMYKCLASTTIIAMNDQPQFVIDASKSTSATPTVTPGSNTTATSSTTQTQTTTAASPPPESTGGSNPNLAVIIGSTVGGLFGLILLVLLLCCLCRRRRNRKTTTKNSNNKTYNITHTVPLGRIQRTKDLPGSSSSNIPGLYGPYVANAARQERGREPQDDQHNDRARGTTFGALLGIGAGRGRDRGTMPPPPGPPPRPERPSHPNPISPEAYQSVGLRDERNKSGPQVQHGTLPPPPQPPHLERSALSRTPSPPSPPPSGAYPEPLQLGQRTGSGVGSTVFPGRDLLSSHGRKKKGANGMTIYF